MKFKTNIDITLLLETWLKDNEHDKAWVNQSDLRTGSFDVLTHNRAGEKKGEGIAPLFRKELNIKQIQLGSLPTIEYGIWKYIYKKQTYPHHWNIQPTTKYNQQYIQCNVCG